MYLLLLLLFSPWLIFRAVTTGRYREGFCEKFLGRIPISSKLEGEKKRVWIHAVSVGEVQLAFTLLNALKEMYPQFLYAVSTTSKTGMELARKKFPQDMVFYCPLDFTWSVKNVLRRLQPDLLILVELELWPNLLLEMQKQKIPVVVINARLSEKSFRGYRRILFLARKMVRSVSLVLAQDEKTAERFKYLGVPPSRVINVGSMKYDGAVMDRGNSRTVNLAKLWNVTAEDVVFLAGSTQFPEEKMAVNAFCELKDQFPRLRMILVPRHPERFEEVAALLNETGLSWQRRSLLQEKSTLKMGEGHAPGGSFSRILLVDSVGELGAFWGLAKIGFVGGSMGNRGGQNMIEAAAYGSAVCFGPNTWNFRDIVTSMLEKNAAVVIHTPSELTDFLYRCLTETSFAETLQKNATEFIRSQQGATLRTVKMIAENQKWLAQSE
ncbi:MAG: 3-deoxy-D-manno-octulosonic acid transferase [Planctomycetia bacterium]|nr:3-deoxy-D-manno-octulosonic acid transferase [Planctomycetia bacterium]